MEKKINKKYCIAILFILRVPMLVLAGFQMIPQGLFLVVYSLGTYLFTGIFLCANLDTLQRYHISKSAVFIFITSPILSLLGNSGDFTAIIKLIMAFAFAVYLYRKRDLLVAVQPQDIAVNSVVMIALTAAVVFVSAYIRGFHGGAEGNLNLFKIAEMLCFQMSFAAVMEEPFFRGILWGYFSKYQLSDLKICLIQAALFWVSHIYYMDTGLNFWLIHPMSALLLGVIIIKTKNITYSMVSHTVLNTAGEIFQFYFKLF